MNLARLSHNCQHIDARTPQTKVGSPVWNVGILEWWNSGFWGNRIVLQWQNPSWHIS